jgi:TRAP-type uncharacterized transport system fused permease subunit
MNDEQTIKDQTQEIDINEIMAKYDKESAFRRLSGFQLRLVSSIAILFSLFQVYTGAMGILPAQLQRSIHLTFVFVLVYLLYPSSSKMKKNSIHWIDIVLAVVGGFSALYITLNYEALLYRAGDYNTLDLIIGGIGILLVLEGARRVVGLPIAIIASVFLVYAKVGPYMPGFLNHRGYSIERIISHMYYTTEGVLGVPLGVAATFIFLFILFGAFLEKTGIGKFFIDLANSVAGFAAGGGIAAATTALGIYLLKVISAAILLAIAETASVKLKLFSVPNLAALSFILAFIGFLQYFVVGRYHEL